MKVLTGKYALVDLFGPRARLFNINFNITFLFIYFNLFCFFIIVLFIIINQQIKTNKKRCNFKMNTLFAKTALTAGTVGFYLMNSSPVNEIIRTALTAIALLFKQIFAGPQEKKEHESRIAEKTAKSPSGSRSALFGQHPDSTQSVYSNPRMPICSETSPVQKSSDLASKGSFAIPTKMNAHTAQKRLNRLGNHIVVGNNTPSTLTLCPVNGENGSTVIFGQSRFQNTKQNSYIRRMMQQSVHTPALERFRLRAKKTEDISLLSSHPLKNLSTLIDQKKVVLENGEGQKYDFGAHFHGYGKGLVKGMNLTFKKHPVYGGEEIECIFKINHAFRKKMKMAIQDLKELTREDILETCLDSNLPFTRIKVDVTQETSGKTKIETSDITFPNIGCFLHIAGFAGFESRVHIILDKGRRLEDLHTILSLLDLEDVLKVSTEEDIKRLKLGHLFHTLCPRESFELERNEDFFSLPVAQLQETLFNKAPAMKQFVEKFLDKMCLTEILPGRMRYRIQGLAQEAQQVGARALTCVITGAASSDQLLYSRIASILKMGMFAPEIRDANHMNTDGLGVNKLDYFFGSADSVFTQLLVNTDAQPRGYQQERVRLIFQLSLLETGTYQHFLDSFGTRATAEYASRPSIFELIKVAKEQNSVLTNEVMIKERIPPSAIKAILVQDTGTYQSLIQYLRRKNLVQLNDKKQEVILGIPLDKFIRIATKIPQDLREVA